MRLATLLTLPIALAGCSAAPDAIVAAAILSSPPDRVPACLVVIGHDPSPALLATLKAQNHHVVATSACTNGPYGTTYFNGKRASRLAITRVIRTTPWRARVEFSSYFGPLAASGWTVMLERSNGVWRVKGSEMQWISLGPNNSFKPNPLRGSA